MKGTGTGNGDAPLLSPTFWVVESLRFGDVVYAKGVLSQKTGFRIEWSNKEDLLAAMKFADEESASAFVSGFDFIEYRISEHQWPADEA